jgi:predicted transcriptional regulator of viral defense system
VTWLEAERRPVLTTAEVTRNFAWSDQITNHVLSSLTKKGWLRRTAKGRYETVLGETGGWSLPNPWAALSTWGQRYYVGFKSAAYELKLTPDRPASVQVCVPPGARRPRSWKEERIRFIYMSQFSDEGTRAERLHNFSVTVGSPEKVLVDGGALPARMDGVLGLARVVARAATQVNWDEVVRLSAYSPRGRASLRRLAALLEVLYLPVPPLLFEAATAKAGDSPIYLGDRATYGAHGIRLSQWQVIINMDDSNIREEVRR